MRSGMGESSGLPWNGTKMMLPPTLAGSLSASATQRSSTGLCILDAGVVLPPPPELPGETEGSAHGHTPGDSRPFGIVIETAPLEFLVVGQGALFDFHQADSVLEVDSVRELRLAPEGWQEARLLNGDERLQVLQGDKISAARIRLLEVALN